MARVNAPQGDAFSAFTTTRASDREQDDHDGEDGEQRDEAAAPAHLLAGHLPERLPVAAHRAEEDHEILHGAAEHRPGDQPQGAGQVAELGREGGPHERTGPGDRGEVVAEHDPLARGHEVAAVVEPLGRHRPRGVEAEDFRRDEGRVETIGHEVRAGRGHHEPHAVDRLVAPGGDDGEPGRPDEGDRGPQDCPVFSCCLREPHPTRPRVGTQPGPRCTATLPAVPQAQGRPHRGEGDQPPRRRGDEGVPSF